jgi:phosphatidate cytidylyltransferase
MAEKMSDLKKRSIASLAIIAVIASLIAFSEQFIVSLLILLLVVLLGAIGTWEYIQLALAKHLKAKTAVMLSLAALEIIASYLSFKFLNWPQLPVIVLVLGVVVLFLIHFRDSTKALGRIAVEFFGLCYVSVPLGLMLGILYPLHADQDGRWWLVYLILVTKITDVGAYFVGRLLGKHRLAPILSPKKTIEGAVAGFLCATLASVGMSYLGAHISLGGFQLSMVNAVLLGMLIGILGQIGDLAESLLKRDADFKDSNALPGLGGVLDMVDSLLFTIPIIYFYMRYLPSGVSG